MAPNFLFYSQCSVIISLHNDTATFYFCVSLPGQMGRLGGVLVCILSWTQWLCLPTVGLHQRPLSLARIKQWSVSPECQLSNTVLNAITMTHWWHDGHSYREVIELSRAWWRLVILEFYLGYTLAATCKAAFSYFNFPLNLLEIEIQRFRSLGPSSSGWLTNARIASPTFPLS